MSAKQSKVNHHLCSGVISHHLNRITSSFHSIVHVLGIQTWTMGAEFLSGWTELDWVSLITDGLISAWCHLMSLYSKPSWREFQLQLCSFDFFAVFFCCYCCCYCVFIAIRSHIQISAGPVWFRPPPLDGTPSRWRHLFLSFFPILRRDSEMNFCFVLNCLLFTVVDWWLNYCGRST